MIGGILLAAHLLARSQMPVIGWEGFGWRNSTVAATQIVVPRLAEPNGEVLFWAGLGDSYQQHIQQDGLTAVERNGVVRYVAWWQDWPSSTYWLPGKIEAGDVMAFSVVRSGAAYIMTVRNLTRHWADVRKVRDGSHETEAEAIVEADGPPMPSFTVKFSHTSGVLAKKWVFPFANNSQFGYGGITKTSAHSFTVTWEGA